MSRRRGVDAGRYDALHARRAAADRRSWHGAQQRLSALPEPGREGRRPGGAGAAARHRRTDRARDGAAPPLGAEMARRAPRPGDAGGTDAALTLLLRCNRSEEHTSELQSLMRLSYAVFCLKKQTT